MDDQRYITTEIELGQYNNMKDFNEAVDRIQVNKNRDIDSIKWLISAQKGNHCHSEYNKNGMKMA